MGFYAVSAIFPPYNEKQKKVYAECPLYKSSLQIYLRMYKKKPLYMPKNITNAFSKSNITNSLVLLKRTLTGTMQSLFWFVWCKTSRIPRNIILKAIIQLSLCEILEYRIFFINKRLNLFDDLMLSNIVEVFVHFWTNLRGVKRVTVRGDITVFRNTFKSENFYFNYHIKASQVNFSPFSRFEFRTPCVHRSVPPNVHLGTIDKLFMGRVIG